MRLSGEERQNDLGPAKLTGWTGAEPKDPLTIPTGVAEAVAMRQSVATLATAFVFRVPSIGSEGTADLLRIELPPFLHRFNNFQMTGPD